MNNMGNEEQLSKKEQYDLEKREREGGHARNEKAKELKKYIKPTIIILGIAAVITFIVWAIASAPKVPESDVISRNGIHYHTELSIFINGEKQDIPADIGLIGAHNPIHTHEADGIVHLEFSGLVKKDDTKLGEFFKVWGRDFGGEGETVKMLVNGEENIKFENYLMKDGDKIEISFE